MTRTDIGFEEALALTLERVEPRAPVLVPVWSAAGLVLAGDVVAAVDSPSTTAAAKDGYAVRSVDVERASEASPVTLRLRGVANAGSRDEVPRLSSGSAIRVTTGASLPAGADAVVATEFAVERGPEVRVLRDAAPRRNVIERGADVAAGRLLLAAGTVVTPAMAGLAAAGGLGELPVHPRPRVAVIATGDEVVAPGEPLGPGQLYASNQVTLRAWLQEFRVEAWSAHAPDDPGALRRELGAALASADVVLTSGGAWKSERDVTPAAVVALGGELVYHRVRLAPGKAVAMAVLGDQVVFCLPGGPPSNEMAFLQLALPALLRLSGHGPAPFATARARLTAPVSGGHGDPTWTKFFQARLDEGERGELRAIPLVAGSRLVCQARAEALVKVPEGRLGLDAGAEAEIQILSCRSAERRDTVAE
jgi:molybdopterin molybdotransferase